MVTCTCDGRIVTKHPGEPAAWSLAAYGITVTLMLRVHTGACPLADDVLDVQAWMAPTSSPGGPGGPLLGRPAITPLP